MLIINLVPIYYDCPLCYYLFMISYPLIVAMIIHMFPILFVIMVVIYVYVCNIYIYVPYYHYYCPLLLLSYWIIMIIFSIIMPFISILFYFNADVPQPHRASLRRSGRRLCRWTQASRQWSPGTPGRDMLSSPVSMAI